MLFSQSASSVVSIIVVSAYKSEIINAPFPAATPVDYCWRILIGLGCVPGVLALYFRLTIPETPRFTMDIDRNVIQAQRDITNVVATGTFVEEDAIILQRAEAPKASLADFRAYFGKWKNGKVLLGTAYSWFALDVGHVIFTHRSRMLTCSLQIAFYGLGLNSSVILTAINFGNPTATKNTSLYVYQNLMNVSVGNLVLSLAGLIPGYWVAFLFIDSWGRKPIQLMGFIILTILFVIMGGSSQPRVLLSFDV